MAIKYKCPICDEIFDDEADAENCRDECAADEYPIEELSSFEAAKEDFRSYLGKCETCKNVDEHGRIVPGCPHHGSMNPPEGCETYEPDTSFFGMALATAWEKLRRQA